MDRFRVEEIIKRTDNGYTEPYICRLSDDRTYVVKGRGATPRGLIAEVVAAWLGHRFSLPIPQVALAFIERPLVEGDPQRRIALGEGWAFASLYEQTLVELRYSALYKQPNHLLRRIFLFDYWIRNGDRTGSPLGGNSNLFLQPLESRVLVLDHNLAFDLGYDFQKDTSGHICYDAWYSGAGQMLARQEFGPEMAAALDGIDAVADVLPSEWTEHVPFAFDEIVAILNLLDTNAFWEPLQ